MTWIVYQKEVKDEHILFNILQKKQENVKICRSY